MAVTTSTPVFKGQKVIWGTGEIGYNAGGICTSASFDHSSQNDPVEDENGAQIGRVLYDQLYSVSLTIVCKEGTTDPSVGDDITVDDCKLFVTGVRTDWQNKGKKQLSITAEGGKNLALAGA